MFIEYLKMNELDKYSQNSKARAERRSKLRQEIAQTIEEDTTKIDMMLQEMSNLKKIGKLVAQCNKYILQEEDDERSKNLIWKYDERYDYVFEPYDIQPYYLANQQEFIAMAMESRNNWIQKYLDNSKVKLYGKVGKNKVQILKQNDQKIYYKVVINGRDPITSQNNFDKEKQSDTIYEISMKQFYAQNQIIGIQFYSNRYLYSFSNSLVKLNLYQRQNDEKNLIVIDAKNHQSRQLQSLRRVIIFKLQEMKGEEQILLSSRNYKKYEYRVHEGYFQDHDFLQPIQLEAGEYIFMPFAGTNLSIYAQGLQQFDIVREQERQQMKQLNLMLQGFPECHPQNMKAEFMRECDLNKGIIIQIYRNVYDNEICFKDVNTYQQAEDKLLMFQSLYSKRYQSYRLKKGEVIVQFYQVTKKPAVLYQPHKKVLVDKSQDHQARTVHSILK